MMLLQLAVTEGPAAAAPARPLWAYALVAASALLVLAGLGVFLWWFFVRRKRAQGAGTARHGVDAKRLTSIWEKFLANLPIAARLTVPERAHFLVLGQPGAGKSALIERGVDWHGQASQFLPSYTADPLLQVYLGSKAVVQELSGQLLESTSRATNEALTRLFRKLDPQRPPTVVLALKVSFLTAATPDEIRQLAQYMRGKINLLSESFGTPIPTRICLTHMERTRGYGEAARFLHKNKIALELPLGPDRNLTSSLLEYEQYLPRALTTMPVSAFQATVGFLLSSEDVLGPLRSFVQALLEGELGAARPELQRLYFFSPAPDEQVGRPLAAPAQRAGLVPRVSLLRRWLHSLGLRPLHAVLGSVLLLAGLVLLTVVTRRHGALVREAEGRTHELDQAVLRAQQARTVPSESEAVRRAEQPASAALAAVQTAEDRWRPLRALYRPDKTAARQRFVDAVRAGYLLPELDRAVRQRSREHILYALVAVYATRDGTLGALVRAQPLEWSQKLGVSSDILLDYVQQSREPWREPALRLLPPLPSESSRWPVADLRPWREFVRAIQRAITLPALTAAQLKELQKDAERLLGALEQVRKAAMLRQIFQALSEESPLDMVRLFGRDAGALAPNQWIVDHEEPLTQLLTLVRDSSLQLTGGGRMSLFRLLKWINELGTQESGTDGKGDDAKREDVIYHLPFPEEKPAEVSRREWLDLLQRSRKRLLLAYQVRSAVAGKSRPARADRCCGGCKVNKRSHRSARGASCTAAGAPGAGAEPTASGDDGLPEDAGDARRGRTERSRRGGDLPLWNRDEFAPKLAALMTSDDVPDAGLDELYSRAVFEREALPLIQELKKALARSKTLAPEEKLRLSRLVQLEVRGYARRYCAELRRFYLSYRFHAGSSQSLHTELLELVKPGSPFLSHLRTVADNVALRGLDDPYLRPLRECLTELQPIAALVHPEGAPGSGGEDDGADGPRPGAQEERSAGPAPAPKTPASSKSGDESGRPGAAGPAATPPPRRRRVTGEPAGLAPYRAAVQQLVAELGGTAPAAAGGAPSPLGERLSPLGRAALAAIEGRGDTPLRMAETFLDEAGIGGALRQPFLSPFLSAYRQGRGDLEQALAHHWRDEQLPQVASLLTRFPFSRAAEREVAPGELDVLSEQKGAFWQSLRTFYGPVLVERGGTYQQKAVALGPLALPRDLLQTVNRLAQLSRALFKPDGSRQPLRLAIRGLPGRTVQAERSTQGTTAFLQVGKAAAYDFNQQGAAVPLTVEWWNQGVAVVGQESTAPRTGRRQTQSIEVADSAWSLFRLLQKSTLEQDGVSTWRIQGDGPAESQALRFVILPDPWALFQVQLP